MPRCSANIWMHVPQGDDPVGGGERVGIVEVLLELPVAVLVVTGVRPPAEVRHHVGHRRQVVVHPGQPSAVVTGLRGIVPVVRGAERSVRGALHQEVLDLGAAEQGQPEFGGAGDLLLQDDSRSEGVGHAADVRVAVHHGQPGPHEGQRRVRGNIRNGNDIRCPWAAGPWHRRRNRRNRSRWPAGRPRPQPGPISNTACRSAW